MQSLEWSNGLGPRSRRPFLLLISGDDIFSFDGENIPQIAAIRGQSYSKNGKWSHTTYRLDIPDDVRCISGMTGWETGSFTEGLGAALRQQQPDTWGDLTAALGVTLRSAKSLMEVKHPREAEELDRKEQALAAMRESEVPHRTYFGFAAADGMFPSECIARRCEISVEDVRTAIDGAEMCLNPSHKPTIEAAKTRFGLPITIPDSAPRVSLASGDKLIVMSVRGLPRLEGRHEYTAEEIAGASFAFGEWSVL